jgi:hypothetical protein
MRSTARTPWQKPDAQQVGRKKSRIVSNTPESFSSQNDHPEETEQLSEEEQPEEVIERYPVSTLPDVENDEAHGGPLGCCLGTVVGIFLTMLLMLGVSLALSNGGYLGVATVPIALLGGVIGGYFGWRIGKAIYRVYEAPVITIKRNTRRKKGPALKK